MPISRTEPQKRRVRLQSDTGRGFAAVLANGNARRGPIGFAIRSPWGTCTPYRLPVPRRTGEKARKPLSDEKSNSHIALYSAIEASGGVGRPPKMA